MLHLPGLMTCCREMVTGKPSPLISSFKLSYYTLLNLMRRLENTNQNMEYVIQHSFQQYQFERTLPEKQVCHAVPCCPFSMPS